MKKLAITAWSLSVISFIWLSYLSHAIPKIFGWDYQRDALVMVLPVSLCSAFMITAFILDNNDKRS